MSFEKILHWSEMPPRVLVVRDGVLSCTLALVIGGARGATEKFAAGPDSLDSKDGPRFFENLDTGLIVVGTHNGAGTTLH